MSTHSSSNVGDRVTAPQPAANETTLVFKEPVEIYFDGSHSTGKNLAAIGYTITDATGRVLARDNFEIDFTTSVQTEFKALIHALQAAKEIGISNLHVYGDCTSVIELARGDSDTSKDDLAAITTKARQLLDAFDSYYLKHTSRAENTVADALAHTALDNAESNK